MNVFHRSTRRLVPQKPAPFVRVDIIWGFKPALVAAFRTVNINHSALGQVEGWDEEFYIEMKLLEFQPPIRANQPLG
jgi:hypothetical protein